MPSDQEPPAGSSAGSSNGKNNAASSNAAPSAPSPIAGSNSSTLASLFQRRNSVASPSLYAIPASMADPRRRMSITTLGLAGSSPSSNASPFGLRRGSMSTASGSLTDDIDEHAVDDDDTTRHVPQSPFNRRMSIGAGIRSLRNGTQGYNWAEQLRAQAESAVRATNAAAARAAPAAPAAPAPSPQENKTPPPPTVAPLASPAPPAPKPSRASQRPKPDAFQERILKGDFYMD